MNARTILTVALVLATAAFSTGCLGGGTCDEESRCDDSACEDGADVDCDDEAGDADDADDADETDADETDADEGVSESADALTARIGGSPTSPPGSGVSYPGGG